MQESTIENYLVRQVKQCGGWALKFISPGVSGVPDRIVLFPGGRLAFVEVKRHGYKPRPLQEAAHKKIRGLGFDVVVIDSKDGVGQFIDYYNDTIRGDA